MRFADETLRGMWSHILLVSCFEGAHCFPWKWCHILLVSCFWGLPFGQFCSCWISLQGLNLLQGCHTNIDKRLHILEIFNVQPDDQLMTRSDHDANGGIQWLPHDCLVDQGIPVFRWKWWPSPPQRSDWHTSWHQMKQHGLVMRSNWISICSVWPKLSCQCQTSQMMHIGCSGTRNCQHWRNAGAEWQLNCFVVTAKSNCCAINKEQMWL